VRRPTQTPGVVAQVRTALKSHNRLATALGFCLGGIVPLASFVVAHYEIHATEALWAQLPTYLVGGGLLYSARTVFTWGRLAFSNGAKAAGFVVLLEGTMVASHIAWLSFVALGYLVAINGVATACNLTLRSK